MGGHMRIGFENNLWRPDGTAAASNADLVTQAAAPLRALGVAIGNGAGLREAWAAMAA
jgi:uncharacterized protein (DUF849 family)